MGFSFEACLAALAACGGDENTALNVLLQGDVPAAASAGTATGAATGATAAPAAAPVKPAKPAGFMGKIWGKSS